MYHLIDPFYACIGLVCGIYSRSVSSPSWPALQERIQRAAQNSAVNYLGFSLNRQISWGCECRRAERVYDWNGLKRGISPKHSQVLFQYTLDGRGAYAEGGKVWDLTAGDGFTVTLPSAHRYFLPSVSECWTFFWFIIQHPFVTERIRALRKKEAAVQKWPVESPALQEAVALFEAACLGRWRDVWSFEDSLVAWLLETEREMDHRRHPQNERQRLLQEIGSIVRDRLSRPPNASELAALHGMERTTFSRKFRTATGLSPAAFVTEIRLEEALNLLRTRAKLEQVAALTGYADANHFCKVFRRHFHFSPGAYRKLISKS